MSEDDAVELVLAIDPGMATGWSMWEMSPEKPMHRLEFGLTADGCEGFLDWLDEIRLDLIDHFVIEDFRLAGDTKNPNLEALEIIGGLRAFCRFTGKPAPERQHRSLKPQVSDELLKRHGLWVAPGDTHWVDGRDINDSAIHALLWAKHQEHLPTLERYWPEW